VTCEYFTTNILEYTEDTSRNYSNLDSFVIHVCVDGEYTVISGDTKTSVKKGECVLIPNSVNDVKLETSSGFRILESYIE